MPSRDVEEGLLRSVAMQNAQSILLARRQAEEALRRSELELADFFENAPVGLHWVGPDGIILRANQTELKLLGYDDQEYVGRHIARFHVDSHVIADILQRLHAGEELRDYEARLRCKDGSIKDVLINSNVLWEDGKFIHSRCFSRDVTGRKEVDETRERLAAIVESSQDAIISKTIDSRILTWNAGAERLFGYTAEEAIGQLITILIPPERRDEERVIIEQLKRGEHIEHYETVRVAKHGRRIDVSITISPLRDGAGRIVGASKIARDITARRQAEQTAGFLARASAALSELTDYESTLHKVAGLAVPHFADWCAVDILEPDSSIRRLAMTHAEPEKAQVVRNLDRTYPTLASDAAGVGRVIRTGELEWAPVIPDERPVQTAQNAEPLGAAQLGAARELKLKSYICVPLKSPGHMLGALTFATAESDRSYGLDDVRAAEDLAHRAVIAIQNARLLSALQESDRRKDEFLAMLAHELRNPLAPIRNAVEIFRATGSPTPELEWAQNVIGRQVLQMTRLVDDLLDVSRITTGRIELRRERIALTSVIDHAIEASRPLIDERRHKLILEIPREPILLDADPARLTQVVMNLLINSAKYMDPEGCIRLTVEGNGDQAVIRVKDTGIGIPQEMLPRIFEMFTQVDRTLERAQGGLGIGLTLVKRLAELHGGTVEARSEGLGKGSEFIVMLPVAQAQEPRAQNASGGDGGIAGPSQRRILVVDDNQDSAKSLAMLLRLLGNEVRTAFDGLEAVEAASEFRPDVVLMDIGLPKLNGYEAARRIRAELGRRVALVALTGWGQDEDRRRSREAGFDRHLTKPVDFGVLQKLLADPQ